MTRVLVVDDDPQILRALRINLRAHNYDVITAAGGNEALRASASYPPDIVVLDLGLPDLDGVEVVRGLRGWSAAPIVVLSGRTQSEAKVEALDAGADDYVTKPFSIDELLARLRAVGRRAAGIDDSPCVTVGEYEVDLQARRVVSIGTIGRDVRLTPTEWQVLEMLVRNPGKLITQRDLLLAIRGPSLTEDSHYLRQYMTQLRRKLEPDPARPRYLLTEPGMGYRFSPRAE